MTERRWKAGDEGYCNGIQWRVTPGRKGPDDLRLEMHINGEWQPAKMEIGFLMADFFFENEHVLYRRSDGYRGGYEYLKELHNAARYGWENTQQKLRQQQTRIRRAFRQCIPDHYRGDGTA